MTGYVARLRAVNVGGTGKLPMTVLAEMCEAAGFSHVRTYIASGNVVFQSDSVEDQIRSTLENGLHAYAGKSISVVVRTASEIADVLGRNPFAHEPGNRVMALFVDGPLPSDPLDGVTGVKNELIRLGRRELFVLYPDGMAVTRLRIPCEKKGTARNINTVAKLAEMTANVLGADSLHMVRQAEATRAADAQRWEAVTSSIGIDSDGVIPSLPSA